MYLRILLICLSPLLALAAPVQTVDQLLAAVRDGAAGSHIQIGPGVFELSQSLEPEPGMTLEGAGMDATIITQAVSWKPSTKSLPDPEVKLKGLDSSAYLIRLPQKAQGIRIANLTLRGPQVHGGIFAFGNSDLHLHHLRIENMRWCGIRTMSCSEVKIHDCDFIGAGGRFKRGGIVGDKGGISSGAIFATWLKDSEIYNNRIRPGEPTPGWQHFGIKGRQAKRCRIHHNTIEVNFAIEFPFENDEDVEIDHNICRGVISIPKHAGGPVPESGVTFDIHHNYFSTSYAIEFVRNGARIHHNRFDFDVAEDGGNLISAFGKAPAAGPASFHNNLVSNPGRGVIWMNEPYSRLEIRNNHIITRTTATPRKEGLFGLSSKSDFSTISITDNIIECQGLARPLLRNDASYGARIQNNLLTNVSDTDRYHNPAADQRAGLEAPLKFACGVDGELTIDGWETRPTTRKLVALTFDDSIISHATFVAPLLKKLGFGATFFITEGFEFATDKNRYMTWEQIKELHDQGFEIGNHTKTHKGVRGQSRESLIAEIEHIEKRCEEYGIPRPTSFCYPAYATSPLAVEVLRERGYTLARAGGKRLFKPGEDEPLLAPQAFDSKPGSDFDGLKAALAQAGDGQIPILTFHGVPDLPHPWVNTTPELFTTYMNYIKDEGFTVVALRDLQALLSN